jgi:hypothetical protein
MLNVDYLFSFPVQERKMIWVTDTGSCFVDNSHAGNIFCKYSLDIDITKLGLMHLVLNFLFYEYCQRVLDRIYNPYSTDIYLAPCL